MGSICCVEAHSFLGRFREIPLGGVSFQGGHMKQDLGKVSI